MQARVFLQPTAQLRKALQQNHFTEDFNSALSMKVFMLEDGTRVQAEMLVTADKKGLEAHRGCGAFCPWCPCADTLRLKLR
eukprot:6193584-Pleurochrysis_carterae.AAC.1